MISTLLAVIQKELLLLLRDKAGLLVLFVMPAVLVVVITLVQENALKSIGESDTRILVIDNDGGALGQKIGEALEKADGVVVTRTLNGQIPDKEKALKAVSQGEYQLCLVIPERLTETVQARARQGAQDSLDEKSDSAATPEEDAPPTLGLYFDPTVLGGFRSAVRNMLALMVFQMEAGEKMAALSEVLPETIDERLRRWLSNRPPVFFPRPPRPISS